MFEESLLLIKPDAFKRNLTGEILAFLLMHGFAFSSVKKVKLTEAEAMDFYPSDVDRVGIMGKKLATSFRECGLDIEVEFNILTCLEAGYLLKTWLVKHLTSGDIIVVLVQATGAVEKLRKLAGATDPTAADSGTIRHIWGDDSFREANLNHRPVYSLVHASDSKEEFLREVDVVKEHIVRRSTHS